MLFNIKANNIESMTKPLVYGSSGNFQFNNILYKNKRSMFRNV